MNNRCASLEVWRTQWQNLTNASADMASHPVAEGHGLIQTLAQATCVFAYKVLSKMLEADKRGHVYTQMILGHTTTNRDYVLAPDFVPNEHHCFFTWICNDQQALRTATTRSVSTLCVLTRNMGFQGYPVQW